MPWLSYTGANYQNWLVTTASLNLSCVHKIATIEPIVLCEGDMRSEEAVEIVNNYHQLYIQHLVDLYNTHKDLYFQSRLSELNLAE